MSHSHFQIWDLCFPRTFERLHVDAISCQIHVRRAKIPQKASMLVFQGPCVTKLKVYSNTEKLNCKMSRAGSNTFYCLKLRSSD